MAWTAPRTWTTGELVTAAIMNTHVRDNFNVLRAESLQSVAITSSTYTTTSATLVDIDATYNVTLTTFGNPLLFILRGNIRNSNSSTSTIDIHDGSAVIGDATNGLWTGTTGTSVVFIDTALIVAYTASTYTFSPQWLTSTGTLSWNWTDIDSSFYVKEIAETG
jgi:hypothetical protein